MTFNLDLQNTKTEIILISPESFTEKLKGVEFYNIALNHFMWLKYKQQIRFLKTPGIDLLLVQRFLPSSDCN